MSNKFHINKNGVPAPCKAAEGKCPLGGDSGNENHFDTEEEAQVAADDLNKKKHGLLPQSTGLSIEQEKMIQEMNDPKKQYEIAEKKTEESRANYERVKANFEATEGEDRRIAGYDLIKAEEDLKHNERKLQEKRDRLN